MPCGTNFDKALDDKLGYYSESGLDAQAVFELAAPTEDDSQIQARSLGTFLSSVGNAIVSGAKAVGNAIVGAAKTVGNALVGAANFVINTAKAVAAAAVALAVNAIKFVAFVVTGEYSNSLTLPVNLGPTSTMLTDSPWGKAFKRTRLRWARTTRSSRLLRRCSTI